MSLVRGDVRKFYQQEWGLNSSMAGALCRTDLLPGEVLELSDDELMAIRNVGKKGIADLRLVLLGKTREELLSNQHQYFEP